MVQLSVWMVICFAIALCLQKRPVLVLGLVLILRILVPSTGGWVLIGNWAGNAAIHPATLLLLSWAPFALLANIKAVGQEVRSRRLVHGFLALAVVLFLVVALIRSGPTSVIGLTNSVLAGILFFFMLRVMQIVQPGTMQRIVRLLITLMVLESVLVLFQWLTGTNLPWSAVIDFPVATRSLGTFDSPLDLGLAAAITIPLLATVRHPLVRYGSAILLLSAVVLSESRTPTIFAAVGVAYLVLVSMKSVRSFIAMLVVLGVGTAVFLSLPILSGLLERFTGDDGNSAAARSVATDYILQNLQSVLIVGNGWGSSYQLKGTLLETSLENGYAILAFDLGGIAVVFLLLAQVSIALGKRGIPGAWLAVVLAIAGGFTYSGITTMSAISIVIWTSLAARVATPESVTLRLDSSPEVLKPRLRQAFVPGEAGSRPAVRASPH